MKKKRFMILIKNLIFLLFFVALIGIVSAVTTNCSNCTDCSSKIQSAGSGDIIQLNESIILDDPETCIDFNGKDNIIFDCLSYSNFIDGSDTGVYGIYSNVDGGVNNNTIKNCNVSDFTSGVYLYSSSNNTFTNIISNSNALSGIYLYNTTNNTFQNLTSNLNIYGIKFDDSSNNNLTNIISNSNSQYGIWLDSPSNNNTLTNITSDSNLQHGIYLSSSSNNNLTNITVNSNSEHGIHLTSSSNNTLENITASLNGIGIYLSISSNNNLTNIISNSNPSYGIYLFSGLNNILKNITASWNGNLGIYLASGSNNNLTSITANSNSQQGIYLSASSNNTLTNITSNSNNQYGISFDAGSNNNTLTDIISNSNTNYGIYLSSSSNNTLTNIITNSNGPYGTYLSSSSYNALENITASLNGDAGIYLISSSNNNLTNITSYSNTNYGFRISWSSNNILRNNNMSNHSYNFRIGGNENAHFNQDIDTSNIVDYSYKIYYNYSASNYVFDSTTAPDAGMVFCVLCDNVTYKDLNLSHYNYHSLYFFNTNNSYIENITSNFNYQGIYFGLSSNNTLTNITILNSTSYGIDLHFSSDNNSLQNITVNNSGTGIALYDGSGNSFTDITVQENNNDFYFYAESDSNCNHNFTNIIGSGGRAIKFYNYTETIQDEELSALILCNASGSTVNNVTIRGSDILQNNAIFVHVTNYTNFSNINSSGNYRGFHISYSNNNTFSHITAEDNYYEGISSSQSHNNNFTNITLNRNQNGISLSFTNNNILNYITANDNSNAGLSSSYSEGNNIITNSVFNNNSANGGISLTGSSAPYIHANNILTNITSNSNTYFGIQLHQSSNNNLTNITTNSNTQYGIWLYSPSHNNTITNVISNDNGRNGIYILQGSDNILTNITTSNSSGATFYISQFIEEVWKEIYSHRFLTEYTTKQFQFDKVKGKVKLRITQKNTEFADIEQIRLDSCIGKIKPEYAIYVENNKSIFEDILYIDNNVIIAHDKVIEISWKIPWYCFGKPTLSLTANEYGRGSPFRYPDEEYVNYIMTENEKTLYKVFWEPSTGHPDGWTYIYVSDDEENVYFSLDVTMDNTNEFGEDWAEIIIKTPEGEKVFRADDFNDKWGIGDFGLTDKVPYKHQTYEFSIPRNEIAENNEEFNFTIRYYGTAGGNGPIPSTNYNGFYLSQSHNNTFSDINAINNINGGIVFYYSSNNSVTGANFSGNNYSVYFYSKAQNNTIKNSYLQNSDSYGIYISYGGGTSYAVNNTFYNNIINNTVNYGNFTSQINYFNTTNQTGPNIVGGSYIGGNYWDNWSNPGTGFSETCTDADSDGICDSAYNVDGISQTYDYLPLTSYSSCTEDWTYSAWSACIGRIQTRTATDANNCGTTNDRLPLSQSCTAEPGGGSGIVKGQPTQTHTWDIINAYEPAIMPIIEPEIHLTEITVTTTETLTDVSLTVTEIDVTPQSDIQIRADGTNYQGYKIDTTKINDTNIANATINFKVNKIWLQEQNLTYEDVTLYRKPGRPNKWDALTTNFVSEDSQYYYFSAISPGFSTFVIFIGTRACNPGDLRCFNNELQLCVGDYTWVVTEKCRAGCEANKCVEREKIIDISTGSLLVYIVVVVLSAGILVVVYFVFRFLSKKHSQSIWKESQMMSK